MKAKKLAFLVMLAFVLTALPLGSGTALADGTSVPGHARRADKDNNGFPDAGVVVVGKYTSVYAADGAGDWYWDLGDGRVYGTVASIADLDQATLDVCDYQNHYRGSFENDPYQDTGWISNNILCKGYSGTASWTYVMVHRSDPRFTGDPYRSELLGWGPDWEFHVLAESGSGNVARPEKHVGG